MKKMMSTTNMISSVAAVLRWEGGGGGFGAVDRGKNLAAVVIMMIFVATEQLSCVFSFTCFFTVLCSRPVSASSATPASLEPSSCLPASPCLPPLSASCSSPSFSATPSRHHQIARRHYQHDQQSSLCSSDHVFADRHCCNRHGPHQISRRRPHHTLKHHASVNMSSLACADTETHRHMHAQQKRKKRGRFVPRAS